MPDKFFQKGWILSQKQEPPQHRCYLGSVFIDLIIRNLPGTALPQLVHCRLVFEAIVQPEGSDQLVEPPDAARQAGGAREAGLGVPGLGGRRGGGWLLLWPGFLVDVGEDVDLVEAEAELAQQRDDAVGGKGTRFPQESGARPLARAGTQPGRSRPLSSRGTRGCPPPQ